MAITKNIQIWAEWVSTHPVDGYTTEVSVYGIDIDNVLANFSTQEIVESIIAQDKFSELTDLVTKSMNEDE